MRDDTHHIAQFNIARAVSPLDSATMAPFMNELEPINARADAALGFVWRLQTGQGDATSLHPYEDDRIIVNMSVWQSIEALHRFVYAERHAGVMARRREWFEPLAAPHLVLWWIAAGALPSVEDGMARLAHLRAHGPSAHAFTFKARFDPPAETAPRQARR
ncbi:MAG: DUF3291 domain-containing protein [Gammaproteobacteria bacterium]|nr:DUF3291 domain-containing protein [Gammaproteobacteria bacterium]